jgi:hypothetical protein
MSWGLTNGNVIVGNMHPHASILQPVRDFLICGTQNFPDVECHPPNGCRIPRGESVDITPADITDDDVEHLDKEQLSRDEHGCLCRFRAFVHDLNEGRVEISTRVFTSQSPAG